MQIVDPLKHLSFGSTTATINRFSRQFFTELCPEPGSRVPTPVFPFSFIPVMLRTRDAARCKPMSIRDTGDTTQPYQTPGSVWKLGER